MNGNTIQSVTAPSPTFTPLRQNEGNVIVHENFEMDRGYNSAVDPQKSFDRGKREQLKTEKARYRWLRCDLLRSWKRRREISSLPDTLPTFRLMTEGISPVRTSSKTLGRRWSWLEPVSRTGNRRCMIMGTNGPLPVRPTQWDTQRRTTELGTGSRDGNVTYDVASQLNTARMERLVRPLQAKTNLSNQFGQYRRHRPR